MNKRTAIWIFSLAFMGALLTFSCKNNDPEPEHYTVCVTCVLLSNGDTIPDHCMRDDLVSNFISDMANAHNPVTGNPMPYKCWRRNPK